MSHLPPSPATSRTTVSVLYPEGRGTIGVRGDAPLSWEETRPATRRDGELWIFEFDVVEHELIELKLVRNDEDWEEGRNYVVHAGDQLDVAPYFDEASPELLDSRIIGEGDAALSVRVLLPPSYKEQTSKRYPVLYVLDGQSLWTTSEDPFGVWGLDATLASLFELHAMAEIIVVAIDTSERRADRLSPIADEENGGGQASVLLDAIVDKLIPIIDGEFRTKAHREDRAIMGSSMGGLFSFFAAWKRSDVFGKAACLSSSFWWADRWMVKTASSDKPSPEPMIYLDSGAAMNPYERDPSLRDGFHHTRSMYRALLRLGYVAGQNLHRLTFAGESHEAAAWAARVALPLQILFPQDGTS
jgi:predicted alpha/beta superfamily hydrolase